MKKIFYFSCAFLLAGLVFLSCEKPCKSVNVPFSVTGDSVLTAGDTIHLTASNIYGLNYTWTGPNGFTSHDAEIYVPAYNANNAGTYTVVATDGKCINETQSKTITLKAPVAPCNPEADWIDFAGTSEPMGGKYTSSSGFSYGNYQLSCNSIHTDLEITFPGPPVTGLYRETNNDQYDLNPNEVYITLTDFEYYGATSGSLVYVDVENGKMTVQLCNVVFSPYSAIATASVTVDM